MFNEVSKIKKANFKFVDIEDDLVILASTPFVESGIVSSDLIATERIKSVQLNKLIFVRFTWVRKTYCSVQVIIKKYLKNCFKRLYMSIFVWDCFWNCQCQFLYMLQWIKMIKRLICFSEKDILFCLENLLTNNSRIYFHFFSSILSSFLVSLI